MEYSFQLYPSFGQWRWRLVAPNGEIIAIGEAYISKQGAINSINLVRRIASTASIYEAAV